MTVVIPSRDRPEMIRRSVYTALSQANVDVHVIVVDDGSTVPVERVLESHPRLEVLRNEVPQGVSLARNRGIEAVTTEWVALLDDDDVWPSHKLERQLSFMHDNGFRWCYTGVAELDSNLALVGFTRPDREISNEHQLLSLNLVSTPSSVVAETALLRAAGGFDPAFSVMADWDLWIRIAAHAPAGALQEPLVGYVVHDGSMHRQSVRQLVHELQTIRRKYQHRGAVGGPFAWHWIAKTYRKTSHPIVGWALYAAPLVHAPKLTWRERRAVVRTLAGTLIRAMGFMRADRVAVPAWIAEWARRPDLVSKSAPRG